LLCGRSPRLTGGRLLPRLLGSFLRHLGSILPRDPESISLQHVSTHMGVTSRDIRSIPRGRVGGKFEFRNSQFEIPRGCGAAPGFPGPRRQPRKGRYNGGYYRLADNGWRQQNCLYKVGMPLALEAFRAPS
jgi:hypothetical protein